MRRSSIGSWAHYCGPNGEHPIPFDTVLEKPAGRGHDQWTVDLCLWLGAWSARAECTTALYDLNRKYG